jgi:hypothetical protein
LVETAGYSSGFWENSDDAIKELHTMFTCHFNRLAFEDEERRNDEDPEWINNAVHEFSRRHHSIQMALEILPRKTFTITR